MSKIVFRGWKLKNGEVVRKVELAGDNILPAEHEGNVMRQLLQLGKKQRLTPNYDRI
jgi:hypothetical protein